MIPYRSVYIWKGYPIWFSLAIVGILLILGRPGSAAGFFVGDAIMRFAVFPALNRRNARKRKAELT